MMLPAAEMEEREGERGGTEIIIPPAADNFVIIIPPLVL